MLQLQEAWSLHCLEMQRDKSKKGNFQNNSFRNKFKKSLMATWDEIDNQEDSKRDEEQANLALMGLTSFEADYGSESEEGD